MLALADHEISRFPSKERAHMPVSKTTPGRLGARVIAPIRVAFRHRNDVGTQDEGTIAAQWLAYALPCRRFACALASANARLGADVDRYSFIASDLHRLLLAGLPAHNPLSSTRKSGANRPAFPEPSRNGHTSAFRQIGPRVSEARRSP